MRRRIIRALAICGVVGSALICAGWVFLARHSRWFIERPIVETPLHVGDVHRIAGPWMHFPDGDMYLLYWDLHRFPWLFHWSVTDLGVPATGAATVDLFGRLHAKGSGIVDVSAVPRFGRGFGVARFIITPAGVDPPKPPPSNANRCSRADTLVYRCRLGPPIGDTRMTLRRVGQRFTKLVITAADDSTLESIALPGDMQIPSADVDDVVRAFDADADGHPDLIIRTGSTRDGDPVYRLWRFVPSRKRFTPDTAFGARVAVSPVSARPCVQIFVHREAGVDTPFLCLKGERWVEEP